MGLFTGFADGEEVAITLDNGDVLHGTLQGPGDHFAPLRVGTSAALATTVDAEFAAHHDVAATYLRVVRVARAVPTAPGLYAATEYPASRGCLPYVLNGSGEWYLIDFATEKPSVYSVAEINDLHLTPLYVWPKES